VGPAARPQRGRYRQFTQCDIDILGVASEVAEIELILATSEALGALGLEGLTVRINDRRLLVAMASWCGFDPARHAGVFITLDKWDKLPPSEIRRELEQAGHPVPAVARLLELYSRPGPQRGLSALRGELGDPKADPVFTTIARIVDTVAAAGAGRFRIDFDPTLVRGMGYYTGPIFEITSSSFPTGSIAGGGRYDDMIGGLLGRDVPATGFSIGFERVVDILGRMARPSADGDKRIAFLFEEPGEDLAGVLGAAQALRAEGYLVALERQARNPGAQRAALEKQGYDGVATVGPGGRASVQWFADRAVRRSGSRK
jgi:histidyl-tRNA synthetase